MTRMHHQVLGTDGNRPFNLASQRGDRLCPNDRFTRSKVNQVAVVNYQRCQVKLSESP